MPEEVVLSTILGVLIIPKFGQLFYHWSGFFYLVETSVLGHLNEMAPCTTKIVKTISGV